MEALNGMRMFSRFLKSEPSLPSAYANSDESFVMSKGEQWCSGFLSDNSPMWAARGGGGGGGGITPTHSLLPKGEGEGLSPWQSPIVTPLVEGRSYGCIATMVRQEGHVYAVAVAASASSAFGEGLSLLYTGSESSNIRVWKQSSFKECGCLRSGSGSVKAILIVGDKVFSAHADHKIRVWKRKRGNHKRVATLPTIKDQIHNSINPRNYVRVRRRARKELWMKHADTISSLAANEKQGLLYSGSWDKTVKVWRMLDFKCVESIQAHHDAINSVAVGLGDLLFTGSADCTVKVWRRLKTTQFHVLTQTLHLSHSAVNGVAVAGHGDGGGILYAGSADGIVNYWEKEKSWRHLKHAGFLEGHKLAVLCIATVRNMVLSGSADKTIRVWTRDSDVDAASHACLVVLQGHSGPVKSITAAIDSSNAFVCVHSGSMDGSVKVWSYSISWLSPHNPVLSPAWVQQKLGTGM